MRQQAGRTNCRLSPAPGSQLALFAAYSYHGCITDRERIFANPMATAAAIDRVVHHSVILEFDVPSYRTNAAQQRGQAKEVNRQN